MKELGHWTTEDATEAEARLLTAARAAGPSAVARARIAATLGVGAGAVMGDVPVAKASLTTMAQILARKGLLIVAVGALAGGAVRAGLSARSPAFVAAPSSGVRVAPSSAAAPPSVARDPAPDPVESEPQGSAVGHDRARVLVRRTPAAASMSASSSAASLDAELQLLDAAKAMLDSHQPGAALVQIARYDRHHPQGAMGVEAKVIRIEALAMQGRRDEASRAANAFLRAFPDAVQVARVRSLLREIDANP